MTLKSEIINSSRLADEELALNAQNGNNSAADELLKRYQPFVKKLSTHYFSTSLETDDIVQEGLIGLLSAIYSFSTGKNAAFRTYCATCINNAIKSALRSNTGMKNIPLNTYISLDDIELISDSSPEKLFIDEEKTEFINKLIIDELSELEKSVIALHIDGNDYRTIAGILNITDKTVDNALQRVRKKLKNALKEN